MFPEQKHMFYFFGNGASRILMRLKSPQFSAVLACPPRFIPAHENHICTHSQEIRLTSNSVTFFNRLSVPHFEYLLSCVPAPIEPLEFLILHILNLYD
jgi:hypothetical protein